MIKILMAVENTISKNEFQSQLNLMNKLKMKPESYLEKKPIFNCQKRMLEQECSQEDSEQDFNSSPKKLKLDEIEPPPKDLSRIGKGTILKKRYTIEEILQEGISSIEVRCFDIDTQENAYFRILQEIDDLTDNTEQVESSRLPQQLPTIKADVNVTNLLAQSNQNHQSYCLDIEKSCPNDLSALASSFNETLMNSSQNPPTLELLFGRIVELAQTSVGSYLLQSLLKNDTSLDKLDRLLAEIDDNASVLMMDPFGNYFMQHLLNFPSEFKLWEKITGIIIKLALNKFGCRFLQAFIKRAPRPVQHCILYELGGDLEKCIVHVYGCHVIQKLVEHGDYSMHVIIYNSIYFKTVSIACDHFGCRVIQTMITRFSNDLKLALEHQLLINLYDLSFSQYGNYVAQHILQFGTDPAVKRIGIFTIANLTSMAMDKYASNIAEKIITRASDEDLHTIALILASFPLPEIKQLFSHPYANFVLKKIFELVSEVDRSMLFYKVVPILEDIRFSPYGKYLYMSFVNK